MDALTSFVAALAAVGVLLVFVQPLWRPERQLAPRALRRRCAGGATGRREPPRPGRDDRHIGHAREHQPGGREARLGHQPCPRAGARRRRAQAERVPRHPLAAIVGIPMVMIILSPLVSLFGSPIAWLVGLALGFWLPNFWLNRRKSKRLKAFNSQPRRHDHAARQLAARRLVVPAVGRAGRARGTAAHLDRVRRASSARSTSACRSTTRWGTCSVASGPMTST